MANKSRWYLTTPIYYVNAHPHIGHSYTTVAADTLARTYRAFRGQEAVRFLTGTDEHGQKIQRAAQEAGLSPLQFVDRISVTFRDLWKQLDISYDDFIRTTEERHTRFVQQVLAALLLKGDLYEGVYEGWYCTPCETFWTDLQAPERICPDCARPVERIRETNYFFRLSAYRDWLCAYIRSHPLFIRPQNRCNEILSFLESNQLSDLCVSRPRERLEWGVPFPFSDRHVTYVWFDALINYISAVGSFDESGVYVSPWWQEEVTIVHLIGKDILRHHAVYWPIMLKSLGIRLPDTIFAHGWWLIDQSKMSKSRGNAVDPREMVRQFGLDTYRYFLLRDVPFGLDGNFSEEGIVKRFNADLANDLGNLLYRTLTMIEKYCGGVIPQLEVFAESFDARGEELKSLLDAPGAAGEGFAARVRAFLSAEADFNFSAALECIWQRINLANKYIEETKPWVLSKEARTAELLRFLRLLVEVIRQVNGCIGAFLPRTAALITEQIGGERVQKGAPLFPRIETRKRQ